MHYLVKLIVEAENAKDALGFAESDAETLVELGKFDWFNMHGRWGDSEAHRVTSAAGKKLLKEGMQNTRNEFDEAMKAIRYMMDNYSDDEIYNEEFPSYIELEGKLPEGVYHLSRWNFTRAGGDSTSAGVFAMGGDLWGSRIDNDKDLNRVLNDKERKLWVVPVDFHN